MRVSLCPTFSFHTASACTHREMTARGVEMEHDSPLKLALREAVPKSVESPRPRPTMPLAGSPTRVQT